MSNTRQTSDEGLTRKLIMKQLLKLRSRVNYLN